MPVNKFGTNAGIIRKYVFDGFSLEQANDIFLRRNGANTITGDINLNYHRLVNVADPTNSQDAATKNCVDSNISGGVTSNSGDIYIGRVNIDADTDWSPMSLACSHDHPPRLSTLVDGKINLIPSYWKITLFGGYNNPVTIRLIMVGKNYINNIDRNVPGGSFDVSRLVYVGWPVNFTVKVRRQSAGSELICSTNLNILLEKL